MAFLYAFLGLSLLFLTPLMFGVKAYFNLNRGIFCCKITFFGLTIFKFGIVKREGVLVIITKKSVKKIEGNGAVAIPVPRNVFVIRDVQMRARLSGGNAAVTALICGAANALMDKYDVIISADYSGKTAMTLAATFYLIPIKGVFYGIRTIKNFI